MGNMVDIWQGFSSILTGDFSTSSLKIIEILIKALEKDIDNTLLNIENNTSRLIHVKLKSGMDLLSDSKSVWDNVKKREQYIDEARVAFIEASHLEYVPDNIKAIEYVAICHECLGNKEIAKKWYYNAYINAIENQQKFSKQIQDCIDGFNKSVALDILAAASIIGLFFREKNHSISEEEYFINLEILFNLEMQLRHLEPIIKKFGFNSVSFNPQFPLRTTKIEMRGQKGYKLTNNGINVYDSNSKRILRFEYRLKTEYN